MKYFYVFCQFLVIILKIYHCILIYYKNIPLFWLGFNIKLDREGDIFNTYGGTSLSFIDKRRNWDDPIVKGGKVQFGPIFLTDYDINFN